MIDSIESKNYRYINLEFKRGICIITFNRPDKKNALSSDMRSEIIDALNSLKEEKRIRTVIFYGGEKFFSAGFERDEVQKVRVQIGSAFITLKNLSKNHS
ncbi:MAG: enoyl-CoA hydratase/isomerase family protein [Candidatus Lokiarchaeota archaeon]|nr:enoyl-CoA hydratase/isomerase family protein [Candidatus Lokiarchaeota archaeon]